MYRKLFCKDYVETIMYTIFFNLFFIAEVYTLSLSHTHTHDKWMLENVWKHKSYLDP